MMEFYLTLFLVYLVDSIEIQDARRYTWQSFTPCLSISVREYFPGITYSE